MDETLSQSTRLLLYLFCGFILAINLSLVFAFLRRGRDQEAMRRQRTRGKAPWESKLDEPASELARKVAGLRDAHLAGDSDPQQEHGGKDDTS